MIIAINPDEYSRFLKSADFANITNQTEDDKIDAEFKGITNAKPGWYCTPAFFKNGIDDPNKKIGVEGASNNLHDYLKIYQNTELTETASGSPVKNQKKSQKKVFDEKFYKEIIKETDASDSKNDKGYFQFFFPCILTFSGVTFFAGIINLNIKKLPINFSFNFSKSGDKILTTPKLNDYDPATDWLTQGLKAVDESYFECNFFEIPYDTNVQATNEKKYSYTHFLNDYFNKQSEYEPKKSFIYTSQPKIKLEVDQENGNFVFTNTVEDGGPNFEITIDNMNKSSHKIINAGPIFVNTDDARDLYYQNCIDNEKKINETQKKKKDYGNNVTITENKNKFSNYYDISFNCRFLKTFMTSSFIPGYHVLEYLPGEIYKSDITITPGQKHIINLTNVYKEIFIRKIIDISIEEVNS